MQPKEILTYMKLRHGHIVEDVVRAEYHLYDGNPAAGSPRGSQRVNRETFRMMLDNTWIATTDTREQRRYEITAAGSALV
jgi:hypothetical protein